MNTNVNTDLKFSVDWLTVCVYANSLNEFLDFFNQFLSPTDLWFPGKPLRFYQNALNLNGQKIISLEWNYCPICDDGDTIESRSLSGINRGILVNISGDGLRYLGSEAFFKFIGRVSDKWDCHYTRIDLACDFYDKSNDIIPLIIDACDNSLHERSDCSCIITNSRSLQLFNNKDKYKHTVSRSVTIGKRGGRFTRIYDKCLEQRQKAYNTDVFDSIPDYWYRIELEVRPQSNCQEPDIIVSYLLDGVSLQECFLNQLRKSFRVSFIKNRYDTGACYSSCDFLWESFLTDLSQNNYFVEFVYLKYVPKSSAAEFNFEHFSNMFFTYLSILPKDFVLNLYNQWLGFMQVPSPRSVKYRNQVFERLGDSFDMNNLIDLDAFNLNYQYIPNFELVDQLPW